MFDPPGPIGGPAAPSDVAETRRKSGETSSLQGWGFLDQIALPDADEPDCSWNSCDRPGTGRKRKFELSVPHRRFGVRGSPRKLAWTTFTSSSRLSLSDQPNVPS